MDRLTSGKNEMISDGVIVCDIKPSRTVRSPRYFTGEVKLMRPCSKAAQLFLATPGAPWKAIGDCAGILNAYSIRTALTYVSSNLSCRPDSRADAVMASAAYGQRRLR